MSARQDQPDRLLPVLYLLFAHLCLLTAFGTVALDPRAVGGFYYHPRMVAVVHLVTLGWISASILGSVYMLGPMVLRAPMPRRRADVWLFASFAIGVAGMVAHFWIDEPRGMVWAAPLVLVAFAGVGGRLSLSLRGSTLPGEVKIHFHLAFANAIAAGTLGILAGIDKFHDVLGGFVLDNVFAHAHLAALGWPTMMVMGAGYRLLPMLLPAATPTGRPLWGSALLLEAGVLWMAGAFLWEPRWLWPGALAALAAIGLFAGRVRWMLRNRRPPPRKLRRPDWGTLHAFFALACLLAAAALGGALLLGPEGRWRLPAASAYGVLGLVGFLAQIVVGVGARLVPLYAWLSGYGGRRLDEPPPSPHELTARPGVAAVFFLWIAGLPLLAAGLACELPPMFGAGGVLLAVATVVDLREQLVVLGRFRRSRGRPA